MYLFFDTETTGLPRNWKAPVTDLDNWPRMVQLAWLSYDNNGNQLDGKDYIIKPDGFTIPSDSSDIHGITQERAMEEGMDINDVMTEFNGLVNNSNYLVAHNISFDEKIAGAEFLRMNMENPIQDMEQICTMKRSTEYCAIDGPYGYKWPKLTELHNKLFGEGFEEAHNAAADITATARCFWEMKKLGIL